MIMIIKQNVVIIIIIFVPYVTSNLHFVVIVVLGFLYVKATDKL